MKLIYLSNLRLPTERAHGLQIMKMCEAFAKEGIQVELIVAGRHNKIKEDVFEYYGIKQNFKVTKLPCWDLVSFWPSKLGFLVQIFTFLVSARFYLWFREFDILYTRENWAGWFFKDFILELHSVPAKINWFYRFVYRHALKITVLTSFIKQDLIKAGEKEEKILVSPDGVDLQEFILVEDKKECRKKNGLPENKFIIGYVGQLKTMGMDKGINLLISAFQYLHQKKTNLLLCIVGGQDAEIKEYQKMAGSDVVFVGQVLHQQVPSYLKSFDIVAMPFLNIPHYAFNMSPLKMFEYMAAEQPIVTSDLPAVREILNNESAFFFKAEDKEDLIRKLEDVLNNASLAKAKALAAFKKVEELTWDKRAKRILNFIGKL
ncbi:MAG: glycosyltransferase family 4 protein [Candidatus Staskawiczbacteria bacterium]|nr:glycosyltransferase family 4 protein [Candidatus Staskawiczbacteria bacterium]